MNVCISINLVYYILYDSWYTHNDELYINIVQTIIHNTSKNMDPFTLVKNSRNKDPTQDGSFCSNDRTTFP